MDSNGRTLGRLLTSWPKNQLMQFCINGTAITSDLIEKCHKISDRTVVKSLLFKKSIAAECLKPDSVETEQMKPISAKKVKRTPFLSLVREFAWGTKLHRLEFVSLARAFSPDIVLLQLGDAAFMVRLAAYIANQCNAKLVVFTTEDYYFKKWNYFNKGAKSLFYALLSRYYKTILRQKFKAVDLIVANTPYLASKYAQEFGRKTEIVMSAANQVLVTCTPNDKANTVVYAGNLGLERHKSLILLAKALGMIAPEMALMIYGKQSDDVKEELSKEPNITLCGMVPYREVLEKLSGARLVLHIESFDPFYQKDLRAAFSTKIPDCLNCGVPMLLYAPEELAETKYLQDEKAAFICTDSNQLETILKEALYNESSRNLMVSRAKALAQKNHNESENAKQFYEFLMSI